eukprot:5050484-Amphidinium_carterae.1
MSQEDFDPHVRTPLKNILQGVSSYVDLCPQTVFAVLSECRLCSRDPISSADKTRLTHHLHGSMGQYRVRSSSNSSTHYIINNLPQSHLSYVVSPTSDGVGQHLLELLIDSLFNEVSSAESPEISMWIDGKQEEQVFAESFRLNPMDHHVKHMMR